MSLSLSPTNSLSWQKKAGSIFSVLLFYYVVWDATFLWLWHNMLALFPTGQTWIETYPWLTLYANHIWAMLISLPCIWFLGWPDWKQWGGLNFNHRSLSLSLYWRFLLVILPYTIILHGIFSTTTGNTQAKEELDTGTMLGWLSFQLFMSGPAEELLFRGLFHSYFRSTWPGELQWKTLTIPSAGIVAALIFTLAHINFSLFPFSLTHFDMLQLSGAFAFGLLYSIIYHRTGSLLFPILAHSTTNALSTLVGYIWQ